MRPVTVAPMVTRHMLGDGGRTMWQRAAQMGCDALAAQENLDRPGRDPCLDLLTGEAVGNAVVVLGDLHMIIEIDATPLPFRALVGFVRQPQGRRPVGFTKKLTGAPPPARH